MPDVDPEILTLYRTFDLIGVFLNGIIGGTIARQRNYDIIGFLFLALFSALGGGMVRDTLMQQGTVAALAEPTYLPLAFGGALVALLIDFRSRYWELFKAHADPVILGVWSVTGCVKALSFDMPILSAIFLGTITAVGGGMIRDVFTGEVPSVFGGVPLYAVPAVVASVTMVAFDSFGNDALGMLLAPLPAIGLAVLSYWRGWVLPRNTDWAPVNMTANQLAKALKRSEDRVEELEGRLGGRPQPDRRDSIADEDDEDAGHQGG